MSKNSGLKKPIIFIGMMGCGKSYIGSHLSKYLDIPFYDSDSLIEAEQKKSASEIFKSHGEAYFRRLEKDKIKELLGRGLCVISTGGGAITAPETLNLIKSDALSIWLRCDVDNIMRRIANDDSRPLLQCVSPHEKLNILLKEREPLYSQADITVDNTGDKIDFILNEIGSKISQFLSQEQNAN